MAILTNAILTTYYLLWRRERRQWSFSMPLYAPYAPYAPYALYALYALRVAAAGCTPLPSLRTHSLTTYYLLLTTYYLLLTCLLLLATAGARACARVSLPGAPTGDQ